MDLLPKSIEFRLLFTTIRFNSVSEFRSQFYLPCNCYTGAIHCDCQRHMFSHFLKFAKEFYSLFFIMMEPNNNNNVLKVNLLNVSVYRLYFYLFRLEYRT